jgi:hypothetical protein
MINNTLQWLGTLALISMYIVMSFYPEAYPLNIVMGTLGGSFYLAWSFRTNNKPQILVNAAGILVCVLGLIRAYS